MTSSKKFTKPLLYTTLILTFLLTPSPNKTAHAQITHIFIDPQNQTVPNVGVHFKINISITDASNLYGYTLKLYYNSTIMNGTQITEGPFLKSQGQTFFYIITFTDNYNTTHGIAYIACTLIGEVPGVNGSGVLATIEFKSLTTTPSTTLNLADVNLGDPYGHPIPHEDTDGTITVIPEFTTLFTLLTLTPTSLLNILIRKRAKKQNLKGSTAKIPLITNINEKRTRQRIIIHTNSRRSSRILKCPLTLKLICKGRGET